MNQHHGTSPDLPDLLEAIGASAEEEAGFSTLSDDAMIASVRRRATALRVRRARTRSIAAVATVATVAAVGVGITQYAGRLTAEPAVPASPAPETPATFPACGTSVSGAAWGDLHLAAATGASRSNAIPEMVIVNDTDEDLVIGSTGWVSYALVRDGVVIGTTTQTPTPFREDVVGARTTSEPLSPTTPTMCDGSDAPEGEPYEVYAYLDAETAAWSQETWTSSQKGWGTGTPVRLWSAPVTVLSPTTGATAGTTFACDVAPAAVEQGFGFTGPDELGMVVDKDDVAKGVWSTTVSITNASDVDYLANVGAVRGVLVKDGRVVGKPLDLAADDVDEQVDLVEIPSEGSADRPALVPVMACADGERLASGTYELWGAVDLVLKEGQSQDAAWAPDSNVPVTVVDKIADVVLD
ncbi:hypothetical protein ATL41_2000 [Flavimobilis soli]|uniref:Uncharacterized protein n=1 Tax=Flavimobilis soli TaxID=442709 RepID=A0A2A9EF34_9MICO|nr:hypothetical protein [Flavimobilis soli]PFG37246.1 hypothetical protein ATL41_2000 [Flavimobilis soli]